MARSGYELRCTASGEAEGVLHHRDMRIGVAAVCGIAEVRREASAVGEYELLRLIGEVLDIHEARWIPAACQGEDAHRERSVRIALAGDGDGLLGAVRILVVVQEGNR